MALAEFVGELFETGRVHVGPLLPLSADQQSEADGRLIALEREYRRELPAEPPAFSVAAARFGAVTLYHACQFLVYRDVDTAQVAKTLSADCPEPANPATHYSVDLVLRFLPDVARLARGTSPGDPLIDALQRLASRWPLSSIGMRDVAPVSLSGIIDHACLAAMYVDRVIAARDVTRLSDARVRQAVQAALGLHEHLAPEIAAALRSGAPEESIS